MGVAGVGLILVGLCTAVGAVLGGVAAAMILL